MTQEIRLSKLNKKVDWSFNFKNFEKKHTRLVKKCQKKMINSILKKTRLFEKSKKKLILKLQKITIDRKSYTIFFGHLFN